MRLIDGMGGYPHCSASREQVLYCVDALRERAEEAAVLLAETMLLPDLSEINDAKELLAMSRQTMTQDARVKELILTAAYGANSPIGAPMFHEKTSLTDVQLFRSTYFTPSRIVLAGTGIAHSDLVRFAENYFEPHLPPPSLIKNEFTSDYNPSLVTEISEMPDIPGMAKEMEPKVRVAVAGLADSGWHSDDLVVLSVLNTLLGGGDSFSAGGPGKGMYSRLYRETLNAFHWIEAAEAFSTVHKGSSLVGISGACRPENAGILVERFVFELRRLKEKDVSQEELTRAKNMLKNNVLTQLESRLILFEDLGRQFSTFGTRQTLAEMMLLVDKVTVDDVRKIGHRICAQPPAIAATGPDLSKLPDFQTTAKRLLDGWS